MNYRSISIWNVHCVRVICPTCQLFWNFKCYDDVLSTDTPKTHVLTVLLCIRHILDTPKYTRTYEIRCSIHVFFFWNVLYPCPICDALPAFHSSLNKLSLYSTAISASDGLPWRSLTVRLNSFSLGLKHWDAKIHLAFILKVLKDLWGCESSVEYLATNGIPWRSLRTVGEQLIVLCMIWNFESKFALLSSEQTELTVKQFQQLMVFHADL